MDEQVRVLVVDDSALMRRVLRGMLESDPQVRVVGEAANGRQALARVAELRPHVITMDVRMPIMDGLETTEHLMAYHPTPILVVTASLSSYDIDITFRMLDAGALDVMEKPRSSDPAALGQSRLELVRRVKTLARMKVVTHLRGRRRNGTEKEQPGKWRISHQQTSTEPAAPSLTAHTLERMENTLDRAKKPASQIPTSAPFPLVVIGASAGGPRVVHQILMGLSPSFQAAVIVVQHIADGFGSGMAEWLAGTCALPVFLASKGMMLRAGSVLVAPDGHDLMIRPNYQVHLDNTPAEQQRPRPSVDITMQSAADIFGRYAIGVLLTGMGRDGAMGMKRIHTAGGYTFAQDEASSPIYGMPRAAVELGAVDIILPPEDILVALQRRVAKMQSWIVRKDT